MCSFTGHTLNLSLFYLLHAAPCRPPWIFFLLCGATSGEPCGDKAASLQAGFTIRLEYLFPWQRRRLAILIPPTATVTYFMICVQCIAMFLAKATAEGRGLPCSHNLLRFNSEFPWLLVQQTTISEFGGVIVFKCNPKMSIASNEASAM